MISVFPSNQHLLLTQSVSVSLCCCARGQQCLPACAVCKRRCAYLLLCYVQGSSACLQDLWLRPLLASNPLDHSSGHCSGKVTAQVVAAWDATTPRGRSMGCMPASCPPLATGFNHKAGRVGRCALQKSGTLLSLTCHDCCAGHSLGGALAQLAAHDVQTEFKRAHPRLWVSCYTLGSPRVGNRAFADTFQKSGWECCTAFEKHASAWQTASGTTCEGVATICPAPIGSPNKALTPNMPS